MKPKTDTYHISRDALESFKIMPNSNLVIVHIPYLNKDDRTEAGIYKVADEDYKPVDHAERWGYVYRVCDDLFYDTDYASSMEWKTEIEIQEGDEVWFSFRASAYANTYMCDGEVYKMIDYRYLYVARRGDQIIPLNGFLLMREWKEEVASNLILEAEVDKSFAVVLHTGSYNQEYSKDIYSDDIVVNEGDHVMFEAGSSYYPLEGGVHNTFSDDTVMLQQRKNVIAVVDELHEKVLRIHSKVVGIDIVPDETELNGIKLVKVRSNHRFGTVKVSSHPDIPVGATVVVTRKPGVKFNGLEYYTDDKIIYYETTA